jgi:hypothetical protein
MGDEHVLRLGEHVYFADTPAGAYAIGYSGLLRLDGEASRAMVAELMVALGKGTRCGPDRYRSARVLVTGSGALVDALAVALRGSGAAMVRILSPDDAAAAVMTGELELAVVVLDPDAGLDNGGAELADACTAGGVSLSQIALDAVAAYWSPPEPPSGTAPVLGSALRRVAALNTWPAREGPGTDWATDEVFIAILARQIAQNVFRYGSEAAGSTSRYIKIVDRRTLSTSEHRVAYHPYDLPARQLDDEGFRACLADLRNGAELTREDLATRWSSVSDDRVGVVTCLHDEFSEQLPLRASAAGVSDPAGLLVPGGFTVAGVGTDSAAAYEQTRLLALAAYGSVMLDPRQLVDRHGSFLSAADAQALPLLRSVRRGAVEAFVRAADLTDGRTRLIPADQAFPVLRARSALGPYAIACGTAAARGWDRAVADALVQHCLRLTIRGSLKCSGSSSVLDPRDHDRDDETIGFCLDMLRAAGIDAVLHDLTGRLAVPVVASTFGSGNTVYGCGADLRHAVREALIATLLRYQAHRNPGLAAAWATTRTAGLAAADLVSARRDAARLADALDRVGRPPAVFVLDHDHAVHGAVPYIVRVVLGGDDDA